MNDKRIRHHRANQIRRSKFKRAVVYRDRQGHMRFVNETWDRATEYRKEADRG